VDSLDHRYKTKKPGHIFSLSGTLPGMPYVPFPAGGRG
jgi:hypothetical protein